MGQGHFSYVYIYKKTEKIFKCQKRPLFGPRPSGLVNNKGADQPAHPPSLISVFIIRLFESNISKLASGNPENSFCRNKAHLVN